MNKDYLINNEKLKIEWNHEKNINLDINKITLGSNKKAWWKCSKGHEWEAPIYSRSKNGCPYCSGQRILKGYNDLATINPDLAREWNYEKNGDLKPSMISPGNNKKVWWKCSKGHEWKASVNHRNDGSGCPVCSNRKILKGYNDLATINPDLAREWNYEKNLDLKPDDVTANSNKKVWWKCSKGHEWKIDICSRNNGNSCPICANRIVLKGYNDLETINPNIAKEWNYEKNGDLKPNLVLAGTNKKVWWKCSNNHEWNAVIRDRNRGAKCPICKLKK